MKAITTAIIMIGTPAIADAETYGHMMGYGYGHGLTMLFGPVLWLIVLGLVVALGLGFGLSRSWRCGAVSRKPSRQMDTED